MATMSSRCQEVAESSLCPVKKRMRCVPWSEPFKPRHWKTRIAEAGGFPRPPPRRRRRHRPDRPLRRRAPQGPRLPKGNLLPSHRKAPPAPSSGRARGLSPGGPPTWPRSRGRRLGTTWRRVSKHVSLKKEQGKEGQTSRSSCAPWARGLLSAFWEWGSPDLPACGLRRGSKGAQLGPSSSTQDPRPSRGAKPRGAGDAELPQARPRHAGSRGGGEIKAGYLTRCP